MKCCVPICRNKNENHLSVPLHDGRQQITFKRFPTAGSQRAVWLEMLGLTESDLPPGAVVCSDHFQRNDFTVMNDGIIKLNEDSIPLQFCMICLASGHTKMYLMNQNYLEKAYTTMTGIAVSYIRDKFATLPRLCAECAQRLVNCDQFRDKSLRAYKALMQLLRNDKVLTSHNLKSVDRVGKLLKSSILKHTFDPDHYDLYVKYNEEDIKIHLKQEYHSDTEENTEIKREKYDGSEKNAKKFYVELLTESDDFQNDVSTINGINNDDNLNCDKKKNAGNYDDIINNDDSTKRDINIAGPTHKVVRIINQDFDDDDDDIILNPVVTNVTNDEFVISNGDGEVKSLKNGIKHNIDIDYDVENDCGDEHNDVILKKNYGKLLNRSKAGKKSGNRVILKNVIFVKDSKPNKLNKDLKSRIDKANENLQFPRAHKVAKCKNMNNAQTYTNKQTEEKNIKESTENNRLPGVFEENKIKKSDRRLSSKSNTLKTSVPKPKKSNSFGTLFTKTILTYEEQLADIQRRQHAEHYEKYPYKCDICFTGRWSLFTYNRHMDKHTDKFGKLECAVCGFRYKSRTLLTRHVTAHAERYSCKRCNFVSGTRSMVILHARWHSGIAFKCPHCELKFSKQSSYFSHVRLKHPSDFACPLCGFSFVGDNGVKAHINLSHSSEDLQNLSGPSCEQCNVRFASEAAYSTHMAVSSKHAIFGIPQRNQAEPSKNKCQSRKSRSQSKQTVVKQVKLCEACGKSFQNVTLLNQHMNVHAGVKPHKCDICTKSYFNKFSLRYHYQLTHSDRPRCYPCSVCHKEFTFLSNRHRHMLTHNPKRPWYTCDICNKSFTTLAAKVSHVAHVHNQVPRPKRHRPKRRACRKHSGSHDASDAQNASVMDTGDANVAS